ncbi:2Fe-2S iron-sulfur cluster-binding protein [Aminobacter niigataensis]|uniref:2Fe-2S iron-sulfur cluster-binding protein n=1 Tax=Aminobacter niigataensis TaxID=83265 RepID=UPI0024CC6676|nr:2Fe-2S iron-sulfur cluster-binding protein [Aminobacter niigataensis]CAI2934752.1 1,2-phenylacetyl-CoA epoxidase, subunit E [Aminobacter niigataensis]
MLGARAAYGRFTSTAMVANMLHRLTLSQVRRETADAVSLVFDIPKALAGRFVFTPGQYLTLEAEIEGERVRRSYSICSGLDDGEIRVAVKEVEGGRFSSFANRSLTAGGILGVMEPRGRFIVPPARKKGRVFLAVVVGSGITPVLSIARTVLAREPDSQFVLVCGNRKQRDILFRSQIDKLAKDFAPRLLVRHVLSREPDRAGLLQGRIDGGKLAAILGECAVPISAIDHALLCGPPEMVAHLSASLHAAGLAPSKIHAESFHAAAAPVKASPNASQEAEDSSRQIEIRLGGRSFVISARPAETIVDAARRTGVKVPYSCGGGTCGSCVAKIVDGSADTVPDAVLEPWEREAGLVLTCQSRPGTGGVVVDYDAAF